MDDSGLKIERKRITESVNELITKVFVACRILRTVLLSAAVNGVQPVLIIEVGTHWRQVKGTKSHLTLSEGNRNKVKQ